MSKRLHVIYVPGVGDSDPEFQRWAVNLWKWWGVDSELFQINWAENAKWEARLRSLLSRIDELKAEEKSVALVGASAGGSAVVNAYAARKTDITGVVTLCAKLKNPGDIGPKYRNANPPLIASVTDSDKALLAFDAEDRARILTRRALYDEVVTTKTDSIVEGARNQISPTPFHALTIGLQLLFGAPGFLRFLKRQNR